ncbi:MAG: hypothetical protein ACSHX4_10910 [Opitutaceae bacterium]
MKTETKIEAEIRRHREKLKQLERERSAVKRRRLAHEQKRLDRLNMLLGRALVLISKSKTFEGIKGHLGKEKAQLVHRIQKKEGEVVEDDTDFRELIAYLDEIILLKEAEDEVN